MSPCAIRAACGVHHLVCQAISYRRFENSPWAESNDDLKLASVSADQRKLIETLQLEMMKEKGLIDEKTYQQALALGSNAHDGRRRKESMKQLRNQSQYQYVDRTLPLASAAFTSLAWQAVFSKLNSMQVVAVK